MESHVQYKGLSRRENTIAAAKGAIKRPVLGRVRRLSVDGSIGNHNHQENECRPKGEKLPKVDHFGKNSGYFGGIMLIFSKKCQSSFGV
jgi:hypothetical protein